ncbi:MAG: VOC family protein [Pseudomonadota bacterium]
MNRLFTNILTNDVAKTAAFYEAVFGMNRHYDSDWFVILVHDAQPGQEFGVLDRSSEIVPEVARGDFGGAMITFVVDDCEQTFLLAQGQGAAVVEAPQLMPYGQRRAVVRDPAGTVIDISSPEGEPTG